MMSSLIFNSGLILLGSLAVIQFCTVSFQEYARYTSITSNFKLTLALFSAQIQNLAYIRYAYSVFTFIFIGISMLTLIYLILKPRDYKNIRLE